MLQALASAGSHLQNLHGFPNLELETLATLHWKAGLSRLSQIFCAVYSTVAPMNLLIDYTKNNLTLQSKGTLRGHGIKIMEFPPHGDSPVPLYHCLLLVEEDFSVRSVVFTDSSYHS